MSADRRLGIFHQPVNNLMKSKKILKLILIVLLFLSAGMWTNLALANCAWSTNKDCSNFGSAWATSTTLTNCKANNPGNGSCCCGPDEIGCCEKKDKNNGKISTADVSREICQNITYASTIFYKDSQAVNNKCLKKEVADCSWKTTEVNGTGAMIVGECSKDFEKQQLDKYCLTPKPTGGSVVESVCCCKIISSTENKGEKKPLFIMPELQIKIPGLNLTPSSSIDYQSFTDGSYKISVPWIAEYFSGIYNYGLSIAGILAAIILMAGGLLWLISAGNDSKISKAKEFIVGGIGGLALLMFSYFILFAVNPELTILKPVEIGTISKLDFFAISQEDMNYAGPVAAGSSHGVPKFFQCRPTEYKKLSYNTGPAGEKCGTFDDENNNICSSGCGVLSSLMVMSYLGETPNVKTWSEQIMAVGGRICGAGTSAYGVKDALVNYPKLQFVDLSNLNETRATNNIIKALNDGHKVVISVKKVPGVNCDFTTGGHFIVLTGWREKDNLIADVNDPAHSSGTNPKRSYINLNDYAGCALNQAYYIFKKP